MYRYLGGQSTHLSKQRKSVGEQQRVSSAEEDLHAYLHLPSLHAHGVPIGFGRYVPCLCIEVRLFDLEPIEYVPVTASNKKS